MFCQFCLLTNLLLGKLRQVETGTLKLFQFSSLLCEETKQVFVYVFCFQLKYNALYIKALETAEYPLVII